MGVKIVSAADTHQWDGQW